MITEAHLTALFYQIFSLKLVRVGQNLLSVSVGVKSTTTRTRNFRNVLKLIFFGYFIICFFPFTIIYCTVLVRSVNTVFTNIFYKVDILIKPGLKISSHHTVPLNNLLAEFSAKKKVNKILSVQQFYRKSQFHPTFY